MTADAEVRLVRDIQATQARLRLWTSHSAQVGRDLGKRLRYHDWLIAALHGHQGRLYGPREYGE